MIDIALKEWAATCRALQQGTQIVVLRKGGLRDEEGAFALESPAFWLQPTYFHHAQQLVKPEFQSLLQAAENEHSEGENDRFIRLKTWAQVAKVWSVPPGKDEVLMRIPHIWSADYLQVRRSFRAGEPILCAALRIFSLGVAHIVPMQPRFLGCRSWLDLDEALSTETSRAALDDDAFITALERIESVLGE